MIKILTPLLICLSFFAQASEHPLATWTPRGPLPTTNEILDFEEHNGQYLVAASLPDGQVLESMDAQHFALTELGLPVEARIDFLTSFNGTLFAGGLGKLYRQNSVDAAWNEIDLSITKLEVANNELWAWRAGFSTGTGRDRIWTPAEVYRSSDGETWQEVTITDDPNERTNLSEIFYEHGRYYLSNTTSIPTVPEHSIYMSEDGTTWEPVPRTVRYLKAIASGEGRIIAGGDESGSLSYTDDGENWQSSKFEYINSYIGNSSDQIYPRYSAPQSITFAGGKFHALVSSFHVTLVVSSEDGSSWPEQFGSDPDYKFVVGPNVKRLTTLNDQLYLVGENGDLWLADDPAEEPRQLLPYTPWNWHTITTSDERLVIAGEAGRMAWSDDAATFNYAELPGSQPISDSVWVPELGAFFLAGGSSEDANLWKSPTGEEWSAVPVEEFSSAINGIVWDGSHLWICGDQGQLARSADGDDFTLIDLAESVNFNAIDFANNHLVITASGGKIFHSQDGDSWQPHQLGTEDTSFRHATFGNGVWTFADRFKAHLTSDFETWWRRDAQAHEKDVLFAFGNFITSNQRYIVTSPDGSYWEPQVDALYINNDYPARGGFEHGVRFQNRVIFVGNRGLIGASEPWRDFFAEWQQEKFSESELIDETISGAYSDPDQDGWSNAFEYAFDLNPLAKEEAGNTSLNHWHVDRAGGFDSIQGYIGLMGTYTHPWARCRPGVITWAERAGKSENNWVRTDISTLRSWGGNDRRDAMSQRVMIPPGESALIRLRAKIIRPDTK